MKNVLFLVLINLPFLFISQENKDIDTSHSVRKATILSACVPGAGQIYNHLAMPKGKKKAFWKIPIIYAGLGATAYMVVENNKLQRELKSEYKSRLAGNSSSTKYETYDLYGIEQLYNTHLNRRDLFIIGFSFAYILQIADAAVEAHFVKFDISEDLSLQIVPTAFSYNQIGIKLSLNFVK